MQMINQEQEYVSTKKYKALIIDDSEMNREILKEILSDEMDIVEIDNGEDACDYMMNHSSELNIVILDLVMPGMNGFEVLKFMKYKHMMDSLPVIMISADNDEHNIERAFDLGVIDFVFRPFSERIVLRRVLTTISLFKRQKELISVIDTQYRVDDLRTHDLTGLDYKQAFFNKVYTHLKSHPNDKLLMIAIDIDHFKLFNNYYGWERGDKYLKKIAELMKKFIQRHGGMAGYLGGDDFVLLCPDKREDIRQFYESVIKSGQLAEYQVGFSPKIGIYEIDDNMQAVASIYDHALIALDDTKGDYSKNVAWYNKSMYQDVKDEYELLVDVQRGLRDQEFTFYIQPKVNMIDGRIVGGEALARWIHKDKGLVAPGAFIPALEQNGFISHIDRVVWDNVAAWQKDWIDSGHTPLPISVNVSRADMFTMDVTEFFLGLVEKYGISKDLIELEVTESAYVEENSVVSKEISRLRDAGFKILMDDFGSGYSSLNSLKDLEIDILKIDMKFLRMDLSNKNKGVSILESIVNMARAMQIPTIVEGVEEQEQVNYLTGMGCNYAQGFFFYKPMPREDFEKLVCNEDNVDHEGIHVSRLDPVHVREFLDENLYSDVVVNNILGPTAFYEVEDDEICLVRMNEQYCKLTGHAFRPQDVADADARGDNYPVSLEGIHPDDREGFKQMIEDAYQDPLNGAARLIRYRQADGGYAKYKLRIFFLRNRHNTRIYLASVQTMEGFDA